MIATFNRMWKADDPYAKVSGGAYDYFNDMGMPDLLASIDKVDDNTVKFTLNKPEVAVHRQSRRWTSRPSIPRNTWTRC